VIIGYISRLHSYGIGSSKEVPFSKFCIGLRVYSLGYRVLMMCHFKVVSR
jgi:hypothetical protein